MNNPGQRKTATVDELVDAAEAGVFEMEPRTVVAPIQWEGRSLYDRWCYELSVATSLGGPTPKAWDFLTHGERKAWDRLASHVRRAENANQAGEEC